MFVYVRACMCVCVYGWVGGCVCARPVGAICVCQIEREKECARVRVCAVQECVRSCVRACVYVRLCVYVRVRMGLQTCACVHVRAYVHMPVTARRRVRAHTRSACCYMTSNCRSITFSFRVREPDSVCVCVCVCICACACVCSVSVSVLMSASLCVCVCMYKQAWGHNKDLKIVWVTETPVMEAMIPFILRVRQVEVERPALDWNKCREGGLVWVMEDAGACDCEHLRVVAGGVANRDLNSKKHTLK